MNELSREGGIDGESVLSEIEDALVRLGVELETTDTASGWTATLATGGITGHGDTERDAAYDLWRQFIANQGGTGTS